MSFHRCKLQPHWDLKIDSTHHNTKPKETEGGSACKRNPLIEDPWQNWHSMQHRYWSIFEPHCRCKTVTAKQQGCLPQLENANSSQTVKVAHHKQISTHQFSWIVVVINEPGPQPTLTVLIINVLISDIMSYYKD